MRSLCKHSVEHVPVADTELWVGNTAENNTEGLGVMGHLVLRVSGSHNPENYFHTNISELVSAVESTD